MSTTESQSAHGQPQSHLRKGEGSRNLWHLLRDAKQPAEHWCSYWMLMKSPEAKCPNQQRTEPMKLCSPNPRPFHIAAILKELKRKNPEFLLPTKTQEKEVNYSKFSLCPKTPPHEAIPRTSAKSMAKMWWACMSLRAYVVCVHWTLSMANYVLTYLSSALWSPPSLSLQNQPHQYYCMSRHPRSWWH